MATAVFNECTLTGQPYANVSEACNGGVCTYSPLFLLFTASALRCLCPSGLIPEYTDINNVTCRPISGTQCRSDFDCNSRTTDCLGISMGNPTYFEGTGIQSPYSADLATFLSPVVSILCGFNDRLIVDTTRIYQCQGGSLTAIGSCEDVGGIPPTSTISTETAPQALRRDLFRILLFPRATGTVTNGNPVSYYFLNTLSSLIPF
ncbi:uncharacterized protein LOC106175117 isoform X3 [Lingula anatina]|uniref:Uncharacterized protein LOC106175117 isoform X2 n=1 Tax=Lingula anatina TaxID=7574 RepID=A0A1S3JPY2_LINAN|nr:uncharacterized protein LOC106175117 isoform X2 [Lingula anatina]XP_013412413.1 uncharacterized protein LOC106175117 isoform X3 [Lingula anatina]|eukprot:XP_013412412.1 uncharacterized protein LOC106175117 isoform X2 [Lingula anatina]